MLSMDGPVMKDMGDMQLLPDSLLRKRHQNVVGNVDVPFVRNGNAMAATR